MIKYLSDPEAYRKFEKLYLLTRDREQRVYSDNIVAKLPFVSQQDTVHYKEWQLRANSSDRLLQYFQNKNLNSIMDLGCGNGWLSAQISKELPGKEIYGVDVNETELQQADRVFAESNLHFCYGNIFEDIFPAEKFDAIILNSCIQYFENLPDLINRLFYFLKPGGEIHILDSPLYKSSEVAAAKQRTLSYYKNLSFPEMAENYFHHTMDELKSFQYENLSGNDLVRKIKSIFIKEMPLNFYWMKIKRNAD